MVEHEVRVHWDEGLGRWRADNNARPGADITAEPEDKVTWLARGSDITISDLSDQVFPETELPVYDQQDDSLNVKTTAPNDEYQYTIYCHGGGGHPAGNAHGGEGPQPVIIIEHSAVGEGKVER